MGCGPSSSKPRKRDSDPKQNGETIKQDENNPNKGKPSQEQENQIQEQRQQQQKQAEIQGQKPNQTQKQPQDEADKIFNAKTPMVKNPKGQKSKPQITVEQQQQINEQEKQQTETASNDNIRNFYLIGKVLGHGSYGTVRLATSKEEQSRKFAIKTITKERMGQKFHMLRRELEILKTLDHPNIVKFYEIFYDEKYIHFIMEHCSGGDLYTFILRNGYIQEKEAVKIVLKILSAVRHMHEKDVVHRDLKPENVLYQYGYSDPEKNVKIIDFGLSRIYQPQNLKQLPSVVGTPLYVAPEVIEETNYGKACDCWSIGVIMYTLLCGKEAFQADTIQDVYKKIKTADFTFDYPPLWKTISKEAKDLISKLLVVDPKKRYTCEQAINHPWFQKFKITKEEYQANIINYKKILLNILQNTKKNPKLKDEIIKIIINHNITETDLQTIEQAFLAIDRDKNGKLTYDEIKNALTELDLATKIDQLDTLFENIETEASNQQKSLSYSQFISLAIDVNKYLNQEKLWSIFNQFDRNHQGYITADDIKKVFARSGRKAQDSYIEEVISQVDTNNKKKISYDMFKQIISNQIQTK